MTDTPDTPKRKRRYEESFKGRETRRAYRQSTHGKSVRAAIRERGRARRNDT